MSGKTDVEAQRRTNSQIGALLLICGLAAAVLSMFTLFIVALQAAIFQFVPAPTTAREREMFALFSWVHFSMLLFMPTMALLGALLAASGWYVRRGSAKAIRLARWALLGALGWAFAYGAHFASLYFDPQKWARFTQLPPPLEPYRHIYYAIQAFFSVSMLFGSPLLLLYLLSRVRPLDVAKES